MFIDPHFDPSKPRYHDFFSLLGEINQLERKPLIEIHRCCYHGSGKKRQLIDGDEMKAIFQTTFKKLMGDISFRIEVFIWDDFHDRHIISNLVGYQLGNGLDTTKADAKTTWTRLGRKDSDDIQREFDPSSGIHKLQKRFSLMNRQTTL